jgi:twitching motility protein PilT
MEVLERMLETALDKGASDLHLVAGLHPLYRVNTRLEADDTYPLLTPQMCEELARHIVGPQRFEMLTRQRDLDFSTHIEGRARFRVNAHYQRNSIAMAFRAVPNVVPRLGELNLPPVIESLVSLRRGLVLITGQTGSGKSTTMASMIDLMNEQYRYHIITLEDPIEFTLASNKCVIEQREVGQDVRDFATGLRHGLRQDPDVILIGEMRDLETTSAALAAAETGHLVLATMHTQSAAQTVERIVDIYPSNQQNQIRSMLSNTLQAVVTMALLERADTPGMIPACEVMICTPAVRSCIRENRIHEIDNIITTSRSVGMCGLDDSIKELYLNDRISHQQAVSQAVNPDLLSRALSA